VGYGGLIDCCQSLGFSRLTHPTLMHIFSCVTALLCPSMNPTLETLINCLSTQGHVQYDGEAVSQLEHALQCATLAETAGESREMILACLFHDIGHLYPERSQREEYRHEYGALAVLRSLFAPSITEPIRLHVEAKRYLCAVDSQYMSQLSPASQQSLKIQGGAFSPEEAQAFLEQPYARDSLKLRQWDEQAKVKGLVTPDLNFFVAKYLATDN